MKDTTLRRRLERALAPPASEKLSPEQVLRERARALAAPLPREEGPRLEVLVFTMGAERWAIETRHVREVVRLSGVAPVPGTADVLRGLIHVRGEIVAVFDLRRLFGMPAGGAPSRAVILGSGPAAELALAADGAHEVTRLPLANLVDPRGALAAAGGRLVKGVTADAILVLDGDAVLADERLFVVHGEEGA